MLFMSACVTPRSLSSRDCFLVGAESGLVGRKPLLLLAFGALHSRRALHPHANTEALVAIQILDAWRRVYSAWSRSSSSPTSPRHGRFNLTLGAISTAVGIGASLSQVIAGSSCTTLVPAPVSLSGRGRLGGIRYPVLLHAETRDNSFSTQPYDTILLLLMSNVFMTFAGMAIEVRSRLAVVESDSGLVGHRLARILPGRARQSPRLRPVLRLPAQDHQEVVTLVVSPCSPSRS